MHDPSVVAFRVPAPIPHRVRWHDHPSIRPGDAMRAGNTRSVRRWGWTRIRNHDGRPVYRWWQPTGWGHLRLAGRAWGLRDLATVWHVEPGGQDMGTVCRHTYYRPEHRTPPAWQVALLPWYRYHPAKPPTSDPASPYPQGHDAYVSSWAWRLHVHHWHVRFGIEGAARRALIECCTLCGRRYPRRCTVMASSWNAAPVRWRDWVRNRLRRLPAGYHDECHALVITRTRLDEAYRALLALRPPDLTGHLQQQGWDFTPAWRVATDLDHWLQRQVAELTKESEHL